MVEENNNENPVFEQSEPMQQTFEEILADSGYTPE